MRWSHKTPYRPRERAEVSQSYQDGVVRICEENDEAPAGRLPQPVLTQKLRLDYQERTLGVQRYYAAAQNQIKAERVIRVPRPAAEITSQDVAITEDGRRYRIDLVQKAKDCWPPSLDLTLTAYKQTPEGNELPAPEPSLPFDPSPEEVSVR